MPVMQRIGRAEQGTGLAQRDEDKEEIEFRQTLSSMRLDTNYNEFAYYVKNSSLLGLQSTRKGFGSEIKMGTLQFFEIPTAPADLRQYLAQEGVSAQVNFVYNKDIAVGMGNSLSIANFNSTKQTYTDIHGNSLTEEQQKENKQEMKELAPKQFDTITVGSDITDTTFTYLIELKRA